MMRTGAKRVILAGTAAVFLTPLMAHGQVLVSEIMYNPAGADGANPVSEWVEIYNSGAAPVDISGWRLDDEDSSDWAPFPAETILGAGQVAVIIDSGFASAETFRTEWSVPLEALVIAGAAGTLANTASPTNEVLVLLDGLDAIVDSANYEAGANGWPTSTNGLSIYTLALSQAGNDIGSNWALSAVGVDDGRNPSGTTYDIRDVGSPGHIPIPEPTSLSLLAAGGFVLLRRRRGRQ